MTEQRGSVPFHPMRRCGRSRHTLRVLSIVDACRSCRRAVPSPAISRGRCARARIVSRLPPARRASCWILRGFPCAALLLSDRRSPPFCCCRRVVLSRGTYHLPSRCACAAGRPPAGMAGSCPAGPAVGVTAGVRERECERRACGPTRVGAREDRSRTTCHSPSPPGGRRGAAGLVAVRAWAGARGGRLAGRQRVVRLASSRVRPARRGPLRRARGAGSRPTGGSCRTRFPGRR